MDKTRPRVPCHHGPQRHSPISVGDGDFAILRRRFRHSPSEISPISVGDFAISVGDFANLRRRMIVSIFVENYANLRRRFRQSPSETEISPISVLLSIQKSNGLGMLPMLYPRERPSTKPRDPLSGRDATRQVASLRSRPARPGPTTAAVRASPVVR